MPSGRTHLKITSGIQVAGLPLFYYAPLSFASGWHVGCWVSRYVNNDLDIAVGHLPKPVQMLGFSLYKEIVPHRAGLYGGHWRNVRWWNVMFFSHIPVLGTFLRFALVLYIPVILLLLLSSVQLIGMSWVGLFLLGVFSGMSTSDTGHTAADIIVTGLKHFRTWLIGWLSQHSVGRHNGKRKSGKKESRIW